MYRLDTRFTIGADNKRIDSLIKNSQTDAIIYIKDRDSEEELGYIIISPMRETVSILVRLYSGYENQHMYSRGKSTRALINKLRKGQ